MNRRLKRKPAPWRGCLLCTSAPRLDIFQELLRMISVWLSGSLPLNAVTELGNVASGRERMSGLGYVYRDTCSSPLRRLRLGGLLFAFAEAAAPRSQPEWSGRVVRWL